MFRSDYFLKVVNNRLTSFVLFLSGWASRLTLRSSSVSNSRSYRGVAFTKASSASAPEADRNRNRAVSARPPPLDRQLCTRVRIRLRILTVLRVAPVHNFRPLR